MAIADTNTLDTDRNKEAVLRFMRLMDSHDFGSLDEVLAPDLQLQLGAGKFDRHQTEDLIRMVYVAFPDFRHVVQETLAVGDRVVLRTMNRATHSGVFQGLAPTERRVIFGQIAIYRMVDGKIAEIWEEADLQGLMQQLGATTAPV
jgi:predicted ester cyclase